MLREYDAQHVERERSLAAFRRLAEQGGQVEAIIQPFHAQALLGPAIVIVTPPLIGLYGWQHHPSFPRARARTAWHCSNAGRRRRSCVRSAPMASARRSPTSGKASSAASADRYSTSKSFTSHGMASAPDHVAVSPSMG